jgi:hypothetical protein
MTQFSFINTAPVFTFASSRPESPMTATPYSEKLKYTKIVREKAGGPRRKPFCQYDLDLIAIIEALRADDADDILTVTLPTQDMRGQATLWDTFTNARTKKGVYGSVSVLSDKLKPVEGSDVVEQSDFTTSGNFNTSVALNKVFIGRWVVASMVDIRSNTTYVLFYRIASFCRVSGKHGYTEAANLRLMRFYSVSANGECRGIATTEDPVVDSIDESTFISIVGHQFKALYDHETMSVIKLHFRPTRQSWSQEGTAAIVKNILEFGAHPAGISPTLLDDCRALYYQTREQWMTARKESPDARVPTEKYRKQLPIVLTVERPDRSIVAAVLAADYAIHSVYELPSFEDETDELLAIETSLFNLDFDRDRLPGETTVFRFFAKDSKDVYLVRAFSIFF